jgi:uncharacterized protein YkwD
MRKTAVLAIVLLSTFLMSCSDQEDTIEVYETINVNYTQIDYEIADLINTYRVSIGLPSFNLLDEASIEAIDHNNYMIDQAVPSHDNFQSRFQNLKNSVNAIGVSENVGFGYSTAESVVAAWLNSEGHKENIENPTFTYFGISTKQDSQGRNYFTNIFVKI